MGRERPENDPGGQSADPCDLRSLVSTTTTPNRVGNLSPSDGKVVLGLEGTTHRRGFPPDQRDKSPVLLWTDDPNNIPYLLWYEDFPDHGYLHSKIFINKTSLILNTCKSYRSS